MLVQNHRTAVIGGLLSDETDATNNGVPFLSNIPVLGNLFSDKQQDANKTNLLIFLTPHVILSQQDLRELSLDERQHFLQTLGRKGMHDMPLDQVREIFKPGFSASVPPGDEFGAPSRSESGAGSPGPGRFVPAPPNTLEIGPDAPNDRAPSAPPLAGSGPVSPLPVTGPTHAPSAANASSVKHDHGKSGVLDEVSGLFVPR